MARMTQQGSVKAKTPHPPPVPDNPGLSLNSHQAWDLELLEPDFLCNVTEDFFLNIFLNISIWSKQVERIIWKPMKKKKRYWEIHITSSGNIYVFQLLYFWSSHFILWWFGKSDPCGLPDSRVRVSKRYLLVGGRNEKWPISPVIRKQTECHSPGGDWAGARQAISVAKWAVCRHRVLSWHCERHRARSRDSWPFPSTGMESNNSCISDHRVRWNRHWNRSTPEAKEGTACQSVLGTTGCPQSSLKTDFFQVSLILELSNLSVAEGD